jgi:hypothetical protein
MNRLVYSVDRKFSILNCYAFLDSNRVELCDEEEVNPNIFR